MLARVKDSALNRRVLEIYNESRPDGLDLSHLPPPPVSQGNHGLLVKALGAARDYLFGAESIDGIALQYLSDHTAIPLLMDEQYSIYKTIYSLLLEYQKQKRSRGFVGGNYNENLMIDHHYLVVGLLGRKVIALVNASDEQRERHKAHLMAFLRKLFEADNRAVLLATRSDDSRYLSLSTVLLNIQILLKGSIDQIYFESEEQKIKDDLLELSNDVREVMADFNEMMLRFAVPHQVEEIPANAVVDTRLIPMLRDNERYKKIIPSTGYEAFFINQFDMPARVLDGQDAHLECDKNAIMRSIAKALGKIDVKSDSSPILANNDLVELFAAVFACRNQFIKSAMHLISSKDQVTDMSALYQQLVALQAQFSELVKQFALFTKAMGEVFAATRRREYEHAKYAYLRVDWQNLHTDFSALLGLMNRITCSAQLCATRGQAADQAVTRSASEATLAASVVLNDSDLEQSFVELLETRNYAGSQVAALEESIADLQQKKAAELEKAKQVSDRKIERLNRQVEQLKQENTELQHSVVNKDMEFLKIDNRVIPDKRASAALSGLFGIVDHFVGKYKQRANCGFWHRHGTHGKQVATEVLQAWHIAKRNAMAIFNQQLLDLHSRLSNYDEKAYQEERIKLLNHSIERIIKQLIHIMRDERLDGNFNKHSLKTYLLASLSALQHAKVSSQDSEDFYLRYEDKSQQLTTTMNRLFTDYYVEAYERKSDFTSQVVRQQYQVAIKQGMEIVHEEAPTPVMGMWHRS